MGFRAKYVSTCVKCGEPINIGDSCTWARRGAKGSVHTHCFADNSTVTHSVQSNSLPFRAPSAEESNGHTPIYKDDAPAGLGPMLASLVQPYIQASTDGIEERIQQAIESAIDSLTTRIEVYHAETKETKTVDGQHERFALLLQLVSMGKHVYLYGEPGIGKSTAGIKAAEVLGLHHGYAALTPQTGISYLFGFMDATGKYVPTEFYNCYKNGGVFVIDECDNAAANLLTALNGALANGKCAFPCGNIERHKDFVCVATGNTTGWGANPKYPERRIMDGAFRRRFLFVEWAIDLKFERRLALAHNPNASKWVDWIQQTRKYCASTYPKLDVPPSASIEGASLLLADLSVFDIANMLVFKGFDKDSVTRILSANPLPEVQ